MLFKNIKKSIGILSILAIFITGCSNSNIESNQVDNLNNSSTTIVDESNIDKNIPLTYVYEEKKVNLFKTFEEAFEKTLANK